MLGLKPVELLLILGLVIFLFGGKKLPELGHAMGDAIRGFKRGIKEPEEKAALPAAEELKKA
jgi:sec-independent protein translocase protein TatA